MLLDEEFEAFSDVNHKLHTVHTRSSLISTFIVSKGEVIHRFKDIVETCRGVTNKGHIWLFLLFMTTKAAAFQAPYLVSLGGPRSQQQLRFIRIESQPFGTSAAKNL
jgi:hypothetical protein